MAPREAELKLPKPEVEFPPGKKQKVSDFPDQNLDWEGLARLFVCIRQFKEFVAAHKGSLPTSDQAGKNPLKAVHQILELLRGFKKSDEIHHMKLFIHPETGEGHCNPHTATFICLARHAGIPAMPFSPSKHLKTGHVYESQEGHVCAICEIGGQDYAIDPTYKNPTYKSFNAPYLGEIKSDNYLLSLAFSSWAAKITEGRTYKPFKPHSTPFNTAISLCNRAIRADPANAEAYNNRANTHFEMGNYEKALPDYNKTINLNPNYAEAFYNRANTHFKMGNYEKALADYNKAINLNSEFAEAYNNRASTHSKMGNYEKALPDYDKAINLNPEFAEAYNNRANTHFEMDNYEKALADYGKAINLNPNYVGAYNNRANTHFKMGNLKQALADYGKAINLNPNYAGAYNNRANTHFKMGNLKQALADYGKAINLNPNYAEAYNNRANTHFEMGNYEKALADYGKAIKLKPTLANPTPTPKEPKKG